MSDTVRTCHPCKRCVWQDARSAALGLKVASVLMRPFDQIRRGRPLGYGQGRAAALLRRLMLIRLGGLREGQLMLTSKGEDVLNRE